MLTPCPDCGTEVSDKAHACIKCGNPMKPTTIEQTGKKFKAQQMFGAILVVVGMLALIANQGSPMPAVIMVVGFFWYMIARIAAWWGHG